MRIYAPYMVIHRGLKSSGPVYDWDTGSKEFRISEEGVGKAQGHLVEEGTMFIEMYKSKSMMRRMAKPGMPSG